MSQENPILVNGEELIEGQVEEYEELNILDDEGDEGLDVNNSLV